MIQGIYIHISVNKEAKQSLADYDGCGIKTLISISSWTH